MIAMAKSPHTDADGMGSGVGVGEGVGERARFGFPIAPENGKAKNKVKSVTNPTTSPI